MHELPVELTVNGRVHRHTVEPRLTLADFLRDKCGLTGTHLGCEHGACGACTMLLDGQAVRACLIFAVQVDGQEVTTVEGIAGEDGELSPVQSALRECHGLQCGFCTPGFVTSITALLRDNPQPTDEEIREGLSGNFCRCTGYQGIINAVHRAAAGRDACRLGRLGCVPQRALDLQVLLEAELAPLAAVAASLVSAERRIQVERVVDRHLAGPDPARKRAGRIEVRGRNIARKTVFRVVGDVDGLIEIVVGQDAQHRAEDLFAGDRHVVVDLGEHRRLDVVTGVEPVRPSRSADRHRRAFLDALLDQPLHLLELSLGGDRSDRALVLEVTHRHRFGDTAGDLGGLGDAIRAERACATAHYSSGRC